MAEQRDFDTPESQVPPGVNPATVATGATPVSERPTPRDPRERMETTRTESMSGDMGQKAREMTGQIDKQTEESPGGIGQKAQDVAGGVGQKAQDVAGGVGQKAQEMMHKEKEMIDQQRGRVAEGMDSVAEQLRGRAHDMPGGERVAGVAEMAADKMQTTAEYVRNQDVNAMMDDLTTIVRDHPKESLIVAAAAGFLIGRMVRG
jgi:hypothetical protein